MREKQKRYVAACVAHGYNVVDAIKMLRRDCGVELTYSAMQNYFKIFAQYGPLVQFYFPSTKEISLDAVSNAILSIKPRNKHWVGMFHEWLTECRKIAEDPNTGIPYADKRKRALKLSQNIEELDEPKTTAKGSYPISRSDSGAMQFEKFEIKNKDHAEQRKTIEAISAVVDGAVATQITVEIVNPVPEVKPEEATAEAKPE
jgi:hypothetical protein